MSMIYTTTAGIMEVAIVVVAVIPTEKKRLFTHFLFTIVNCAKLIEAHTASFILIVYFFIYNPDIQLFLNIVWVQSGCSLLLLLLFGLWIIIVIGLSSNNRILKIWVHFMNRFLFFRLFYSAWYWILWVLIDILETIKGRRRKVFLLSKILGSFIRCILWLTTILHTLL